MDLNGEHVRELFEAALEGGLTPDDQARLDAHLAGCPACREELEFARAVRARRAELAPRLSGAEIFRIRSAIADRIEGGAEAAVSRRLVPVPVLVSGMAVAALALWFAAGLQGPVTLTRPRPALDLGVTLAGDELRREQFAALKELGIRAAPPRAWRGATVVTDFEAFADLENLAVTGFAPPALGAPGYSGRRALRLGRCGESGAPAEVRIRFANEGTVLHPVAVTAWMRCAEPATVRLTAGLYSGATVAGTPERLVAPGAWRWVAFGLDREEVGRGQGVVDLRLEIECAGPVTLDRVETWKGGPP